MPLSDAARRLLKNRSTTPAPPEPVVPPSPAPGAVQPAAASGRGTFKDRARREQERMNLATDSEYWFALCFRHPDDCAAFAAALGLTPSGRKIRGPDLEAATSSVRAVWSPAARRNRMLTARSTRGTDITSQLTAPPVPDPLAATVVTDDIAADSAAELNALHAALTAPPDPAPVHVLDSPHWLVAYWAARAAKDTYLAATGLEVLGDKYLDGHQAASILGIQLAKGR